MLLLPLNASLLSAAVRERCEFVKPGKIKISNRDAFLEETKVFMDINRGRGLGLEYVVERRGSGNHRN